MHDPRVKITYAGKTIELLGSESTTIDKEAVGQSVTTASGKIVYEAIGVRKKPTFEYEYLPLSDYQTLAAWAAAHRWVDLYYLDDTAGWVHLTCSISLPTPELFDYVDGKPYWKAGKITFTAQEVV